jgi:uncharacterized C2H2 Zn-finger protein
MNDVPRDPYTLDTQIGFVQFAEWWRRNEAAKDEREGRRPEKRDREVERDLIQAAYDVYKETFHERFAKQFTNTHKNEEWFKELYDPIISVDVQAKVAIYRREQFRNWAGDLHSGMFDEFTLEGIHKNETNGGGIPVEKEEGETVGGNEMLAVGDLVPTKTGDIRDETIHQPTLLIKTIAPSVSRQRLEEFCKEHLGEAAGGFHWLSLTCPNPGKRFHRIGFVILHPADDTMEQSERAEIRDDEDDGEMAEDAAPKEGFSDDVQAVAQRAADAINGKTLRDDNRDFTCHVGVHNPPRDIKKKALWDLFSFPERVEKDLGLAQQLALKLENDLVEADGTAYNGLDLILEKVEDLRSKGLLQPPLETAMKKEASDTEMDEGELEPSPEEEETDSEELLIMKKKLDLIVEYLRRTFNFCFFCVHSSDSIHELTRKCGGGHLRRPRSSLTAAAKEVASASARGAAFPSRAKEAAEDGEVEDDMKSRQRKPQLSKAEQQLSKAYGWVKTFEDKLALILHPEDADLRKLGGRPIEEALEEDLRQWVKQEDESRYRCRVPECTKLFKSDEFWRKHVEKRHEDWLEIRKRDVSFLLLSPWMIQTLMTNNYSSSLC